MISATACDNAARGCENGYRVHVTLSSVSPVMSNTTRTAKLCFACYEQLEAAMPPRSR